LGSIRDIHGRYGCTRNRHDARHSGNSFYWLTIQSSGR
jgi:hypothetical protein